MKRGVTKRKFCISIDKDIYDLLEKECNEYDAKISTRINSILKRYAKEKNPRAKKSHADKKEDKTKNAAR